jgi:hypothetical protein
MEIAVKHSIDVIGIRRDDLGVESVRIHRLRKGEGARPGIVRAGDRSASRPPSIP